jgi:hypothetical protein
MTSIDGITWVERTVPSGLYQGVCWSPDLNIFVAVGKTTFMRSNNGIDWVSSAASARDWYSVCWSKELQLFATVAAIGAPNILTSSDGITWTTRTAGVGGSLHTVCWSNELKIFVATINSSGTTIDQVTHSVFVSSNGINWTPRFAPGISNWTGICWSSRLNLFVAVCSNSSTNSNTRAMTNTSTWNLPYMNIKGVAEVITPKTLTSNTFSVDFLNDSNVISITPFSATPLMTVNITSVPVTANRSHTITFMINTSATKQRIGTVSVNNGTARTILYNGTIPSLTSAIRVIQTVTIVYGPTSAVDAVYSSVDAWQ